MFFRKKKILPKNFKLGKWETKGKELDELHENFYDRIVDFAIEIGEDPYNRDFNMEPIIDFAVEKGITTFGLDYIYRHYVYNKLSKIERINIDDEELNFNINDFQLVHFPENN